MQRIKFFTKNSGNLGLPRWLSFTVVTAFSIPLFALPFIGFGNDSAAMAFIPQSLDAVGGEFRAVMESFEQAKSAMGIGEKPLVVICAGHPPKGTHVELVGKFSLWQDMQKDLLSLSSNSRFVIAEESSHEIQSAQPDFVVQAIRDVVEAARNGTRLSAAEAATTQ